MSITVISCVITPMYMLFVVNMDDTCMSYSFNKHHQYSRTTPACSINTGCRFRVDFWGMPVLSPTPTTTAPGTSVNTNDHTRSCVKLIFCGFHYILKYNRRNEVSLYTDIGLFKLLVKTRDHTVPVYKGPFH